LEKAHEAENNRSAADDALAEAEGIHRRAAEKAREMLEALSGVRETRAREEERLEAARLRREEIVGQVRELFSCPPQNLREETGLKPEAPLPELEATETKVDRLKRERERLGGVNLRAEEEAREIETRLETILSEREDLEAAIRQLRQGISTLNREARERLINAFDEVNGHFQSLFTHLFGGGTAELTLTESDDRSKRGLRSSPSRRARSPRA